MTKKAKMAPAERAAKERLLSTLSVLSPEDNAAEAAMEFAKGLYGEIDAQVFSGLLRQRIAKGDSKRTSEETLLSQAAALDVLFASLARRAALNMGSYPEAGDTYLRLALRAQNQCRMTLETLATIKNPPVVFAKQANIAHGPQQVNNGTAVAPAEQTDKAPTELLEHDHGERLDTGTAAAATGSDQAVATVVEIHRPAQRPGQNRV
jgi:hypothetical protein